MQGFIVIVTVIVIHLTAWIVLAARNNIPYNLLTALQHSLDGTPAGAEEIMR